MHDISNVKSYPCVDPMSIRRVTVRGRKVPSNSRPSSLHKDHLQEGLVLICNYCRWRRPKDQALVLWGKWGNAQSACDISDESSSKAFINEGRFFQRKQTSLGESFDTPGAHKVWVYRMGYSKLAPFAYHDNQ